MSTLFYQELRNSSVDNVRSDGFSRLVPLKRVLRTSVLFDRRRSGN